ncbi:MAG TPA: CPBP family intramembrane glutamic endopeptidase [Gemmatimonadales bacterium]|nr:CPBP family intramembrane glutamic endopeptidase [Gemmatimonadales bacterium]
MNRAYWQASRAPRYSLLFALPLLVLYQILALIVPPGEGGIAVRNGADVLLQAVFVWLAGAWGPRLFMACLIAVGVWLMARDLRSHPGRLSPAILGAMLVESIFLALAFGVVVGGLTAALLGAPPPAILLSFNGEQLGRWTVLMLSIGAGIYEELLFRVVLVGLLAWGARRVLGLRPLIAGLVATFVGALVFSAFHYIGPYGDPLDVYSFVFRTIAGLFFSGLYLVRGFGITAWTHALYDVFLLFR